MSGKASRTGLIGCVAALLWLIAASSAHAAPAWLPAFDLGFPVTQVVMASDGTTVYAGRPFVAGSYRVAVQVRPPGGPLGAVQYLSPDGGSPQGFALATGGDGRVAFAWIEGNSPGIVETAVLPAGGVTFGDAEAMPTTAGESPGGNPAAAVDGAGDVLVLWGARGTSGSPPPVYLRFGERPASAAAPTTQLVDSSGGLGPNESVSMQDLSVEAADDGSAVLAWLRSYSNSNSDASSGTVFARLRTPGQPFGATSTIDSASVVGPTTYPQSFIGSLSAAMTPGGHAGVTWTKAVTATNGAAQTWTISFKEGDANAGLGATADATPGFGNSPFELTLALGPDGRVAIAALANVSGTARPQVALRPPGGVFGIVQNLAPTGPPAAGLDIAAGAAGELNAVWATGSLGSLAISASAAAPGGTFGPGSTLASNLASLNIPRVAVGPKNDGVAAWSTNSTGAAAGFDASPPSFPAPAFPAAATVGVPAAFAVGAPSEVWGPVASITWDFGDGATAAGTSVSHTYAAPGSATAKLVVTDAAGNAASASSTVPVAAAAAPADTTAPVVTGASLSRKVFAVGAAPTALTAKRHKRGTVIRFTLSEAASVKVAMRRAAAGRRRGARCVTPTAKLRHARRCTRYVLKGTLQRSGKAGANAVAFSGRLGKRALKPGRYRAVITATDAAHNAGKPVTLSFRIVRR
jgi:hypothetical protein